MNPRTRQRVGRFTLLAIAILLLAKASLGATPSSLDLGLSVTSYQVGRLSANDSGAKSAMKGTNFYHLGVQYHAPISTTLFFSPMLRYMPESLSSYRSPEGGSRSSLIMLGLPIVMNLDQAFDVSAGLALLRYTVTGSGGTIILDNGSGKAEFAQPGGTKTSSTWALQLGGAYNYQSFRFSLDLLTQGLLSSQNKRAFSVMLSGAYSAYKF